MMQRTNLDTARHIATTFSRPSAVIVRATLAAACLIVLLAYSLSFASAQGAHSNARQACEADYRRACSGVLPGGGRVRQCLTEHLDTLSDACKQAVSAGKVK